MAVRAKRVEVSDHWVDAGPFRAQLRYLMASGSLTLEDVAAVAGISARLAGRLLHGRDGRPLRRRFARPRLLQEDSGRSFGFSLA